MTMVRRVVVSVLLVCGLAVGVHAESKEEKAKKAKQHEDAVKAAIDGFVGCAYASASANASGTGTASEIAEAALGDCGREFTEYQRAAREFFLASVRDTRLAIQHADADAAGFKEQVRRVVISRVLRARRDAANPSER